MCVNQSFQRLSATNMGRMFIATELSPLDSFCYSVIAVSCVQFFINIRCVIGIGWEQKKCLKNYILLHNVDYGHVYS